MAGGEGRRGPRPGGHAVPRRRLGGLAARRRRHRVEALPGCAGWQALSERGDGLLVGGSAQLAARCVCHAGAGADADAEASLRELTRAVRRSKRRDYRVHIAQLVDELQEAWRVRDMSLCWRLMRAIAGGYGPKFRRYDAPKHEQVSADDWADFLGRDPPQGGCRAERADPVAELDRRLANLEERTTGDFQDCLEAADDVLVMEMRLRGAKLRRSVPPWSLPGEVWRLLLDRRPRHEDRYSGIGARVAPLVATRFRRAVAQVLHCVRATRVLPVSWSTAQCYFFDMHNHKEGCDAQRLIACFCSFSKLFLGNVWQRGVVSRSSRPWSYGYEKRKRREMASMVQWCLGARLSALRRGHVTVFYDLKNAFWCHEIAGEAGLQALVEDLAKDPASAALLGDHLGSMALCVGRGDDGDVHVRPRSGGAPGGVFVAQLFSNSYNPCVDACLEATEELSIPARMDWIPEGAVFSDVGVTVYADDIARKFLVRGMASLHRRTRTADASLDSSIGRAGYTQNHGKKQGVVRLFGAGSFAETKRVYASGAHLGWEPRPQAKYLGALYHLAGSTVGERNARLGAARRQIGMLRKVLDEAPARVSRVAVQCAVAGALLAGWAALVPREGDLRAFDSFMARVARRWLRGRASGKTTNDQGVAKYSAWSNSQVFRMFGWATADVELASQRMRFWQSVFSSEFEPSDQLLAAVFGDFCDGGPATFDNEGKLADGASEWARLMRDIERFEPFDDAQDLLRSLDGRLRRLLVDDECRRLFCELDTSVLRAATRDVAIPPSWDDPQALACLAEDRAYVCEVCGTAFASWRPVQVHCVHAHDQWCRAVKSQDTEQCVICQRILSSIVVAKRHVARSLAKGSCAGARGSAYRTLATPFPLRCPVCDFEADDPSAARVHRLLFHVAPLLPDGAGLGEVQLEAELEL